MKSFYKYIGILALIALITISVYFFVRIYYFTISGYTGINLFFSTLLLLAEIQLILQAVGLVINILRLNHKRFIYPKYKDLASRPSVAIVVAAKNEPAKVLEKTFITLNAINYPNKNIYFLEDSIDKKYIHQDKILTKKYNINFFQPNNLHGAKAGIINDFVSVCKEKYIAVFDADQNPFPDFLTKTVPIIEKDKNIAFVQTPQFYYNIATGPIPHVAEMQQAIFYESICEAKSSANAMFCCGSNVIIRTKALKEVGGFDEDSITEDFATSIKFHTRGYKSIYYNHVRTFGLGPIDLAGYLKQQARWAAGTLGTFKKIIITFFKNPFSMTINQWWEYYLSSTYYLIGWVFFILILCPALFLIFNIPNYFILPQVYIISFIPYYITTLLLFYITMRKRNYRLIDIYEGIIMGSFCFPTLMKATIVGLFAKKQQFHITSKSSGGKMPLISLWPWYLMIAVLLIAIGFGISKWYINPYAMTINIFWCTYHLFIILHVIYFNQKPKIIKDNLRNIYDKYKPNRKIN